MSHPINAIISGFADKKPGKLQIGVSADEINKFCRESRTPRPYVNRYVKELTNILDFQVNYDNCFEGKIKENIGKLCVIHIKSRYYKFADKTGKTIEGYKFSIEDIKPIN